MGCSVSQHAEFARRLADVEKRIKAMPKGKRNEGLLEIEAVAREICQFSEELKDAGVKNREATRRMEVISDIILDNLAGRLTSGDLQEGREACKEWLDNIEKVAKMLDAVRTTKASTALSKQIEDKLQKVSASAERCAEFELQMMLKGCETLKKDQRKIVQVAEKIVEYAQNANEFSPDSRTVSEISLQGITTLTGIILQQHKAWAVSYSGCVAMMKVAADVDALATRLVGIVDSIRVPPLQPKVVKRQAKSAEEISKQQLKIAEIALRNSQMREAFDSLSNLHAWWPLLKEMDGVGAQIASIFNKISTYISDQYAKSTDNEDAKKSIKAFVSKVKGLRAQYEGLAPPSDCESLLFSDGSLVGERAGKIES